MLVNTSFTHLFFRYSQSCLLKTSFPHLVIRYLQHLKKMGIIISGSNPHCHLRLSKPILKILSVYRKNILGKQLSQAICTKYVFRLLHAPKFQVFSTKLNVMVKAVKQFPGVLWKSSSDEFYKKAPMRTSLFK